MFSTLGHIFLSFLTAPVERMISSAMVTVVEDFARKGRQTLLLVMGTFVLSLLFAAGVIIALIEASALYDKGGIYMSGLLASSLILTTLSFISLAVVFWPRKIEVLSAEVKARATIASSPLEELMTAVVNQVAQSFKNRHEENSRPRNYSRA